jgi:branched-chain amino acid transport system ATP-binding protein
VSTEVRDAHVAPVAAVDPIFAVEHVTLRFGGLTSLDDVSFEHERGSILAVIGPNGAGKTSLFNSLTGVYRPQEGLIAFSALGKSPQRIGAKRPFRVSRMGVARTFQTSRMFGAMTAFENVKIGVEARQRTGPIGAILRLPRTRREEHESDVRSLQLLEFVDLAKSANVTANSLPYGDRRRLEIARALATNPEVLLLDEPAAGANPAEKVALAALIARVRNELGVSILLIEHDMKLVMSIAERIIVLNFGRIIATGTPAEIQHNPVVVDAYLGTSHAAAEPGEPTAPPETPPAT